MKQGDIIAANENVKKASAKLQEERRIINIGVKKLLFAEEGYRKVFFEIVLAQFPEVEGWEFSYDHNLDEITLLRQQETKLFI